MSGEECVPVPLHEELRIEAALWHGKGAVANLPTRLNRMADEAENLQRQLAEARDALTTIRDSTFRTAIILRAIADRALKK